MVQINETDALNEAITLLENRQAEELFVLKQQFNSTYDSLKPLNLIKSAFTEITSSPDIKNNLVNSAIGLTTGYLTKKVLLGFTPNPIRRILGSLLQFVVANVVSKKSDSYISKEY